MRDASRARPPRGKGGHCGDLSKEAKELGGGDVGCWKGRRKARLHCSAALPGLARPRLSRFWLLVAVVGAARDGSVGRTGVRISCFRSAAAEGGIHLLGSSFHALNYLPGNNLSLDGRLSQLRIGYILRIIKTMRRDRFNLPSSCTCCSVSLLILKDRNVPFPR